MLVDLVKPLGIAAFAMLLVTSFLGIARWKLRWYTLKPIWHYALAIMTLFLAAAHVTVVLMVD